MDQLDLLSMHVMVGWLLLYNHDACCAWAILIGWLAGEFLMIAVHGQCMGHGLCMHAMTGLLS